MRLKERRNGNRSPSGRPSLDDVEVCVELVEDQFPGIRDLISLVAARDDRRALEEAMRRIESLKLYADEMDVQSVGHMMRSLEDLAVGVYYRLLMSCAEEELL